MVYPGTLFIGDNVAFLCNPMKIGVTFEHGVATSAPEPLLWIRSEVEMITHRAIVTAYGVASRARVEAILNH